MLPVLAATVCVALAAEDAPLTDAQRRLNVESFELVWSTVRQRHFDPNLHGVDWNAAKHETMPLVARATGMGQFRSAVMGMLSRLGQSHFAIIPGELYKAIDRGQAKKGRQTGETGRRPDAADRGAEQGVTGIEPGVIDGRASAIEVDPGSPSEEAGVRPGWWINRIDGLAMGEILALTQ